MKIGRVSIPYWGYALVSPAGCISVPNWGLCTNEAVFHNSLEVELHSPEELD